MNKLISKNLVLRFKLGRKITKAQFGTDKIKIGMDVPKIYYLIPLYDLETILKVSSIPSIPARPYPYKGSKIKIGILKTPNINPSITSVDPYLTSGSTKGGMLREYEQNLINDLASKKPKPKKTPVNNVWLKGYKHDEIKDVRAMLNKLIKLGLLKDKFGADGKWGKNTEAAYEAYKKIAFNPQTIPAVELIEKTPDYMDSPINNSQIDLAGIAKQYLYAKQGGLLPSRNPIKRFKEKNLK